jgi:hypothetical protein
MLSLSACLVGAGEVLAEISVKTWSPPTAMTSGRTTVEGIYAAFMNIPLP